LDDLAAPYAIDDAGHGDLSSRVEKSTTDEFGTLADGFNGMSEHLQSMYQHLESKVSEKTAEIEEKRKRLEGLYEVTALVANATTLDELAQGFSKSIARIAHADGVVVVRPSESTLLDDCRPGAAR
jgi:two-component system nitrate/nitrite sensor histidine kinase NarX